MAELLFLELTLRPSNFEPLGPPFGPTRFWAQRLFRVACSGEAGVFAEPKPASSLSPKEAGRKPAMGDCARGVRPYRPSPWGPPTPNQQLKLSTMLKGYLPKAWRSWGQGTPTKLSGGTAVERVPPLDVLMVAERQFRRPGKIFMASSRTVSPDQASAV